MPTSGSSPSPSHHWNQRRSWYAYSSWVCPAYRAKNETAASWAVVIDIGWNGRSSDVVDMEHLTRRPTPRPRSARRRHGEALEHTDAKPACLLRRAAE